MTSWSGSGVGVEEPSTITSDLIFVFGGLPFGFRTALAFVVFMQEESVATGVLSAWVAARFFAGTRAGFATGLAAIVFGAVVFLLGVEAVLMRFAFGKLDLLPMFPVCRGVVIGAGAGRFKEEDCLPIFLRARFCLATPKSSGSSVSR